MPLTIKKVSSGYLANVSHKHQNIFWENKNPMSRSDLIKQLLKLGCHQQDISDAFKKADLN